MSIAPAPQYAERSPNTYERKYSPALPGNRGPLRYEEGIATDSDVPSDFQVGAMQGYISSPGRPNRNANVWEKYPDETMRQRAHLGSAAWVEAPTFLGEFAQGSFSDYAQTQYEEVIRNGGRYERLNPASVDD